MSSAPGPGSGFAPSPAPDPTLWAPLSPVRRRDPWASRGAPSRRRGTARRGCCRGPLPWSRWRSASLSIARSGPLESEGPVVLPADGAGWRGEWPSRRRPLPRHTALPPAGAGGSVAFLPDRHLAGLRLPGCSAGTGRKCRPPACWET